MFILQTGGENSFIAINKEEGYYAASDHVALLWPLTMISNKSHIVILTYTYREGHFHLHTTQKTLTLLDSSTLLLNFVEAGQALRARSLDPQHARHWLSARHACPCCLSYNAHNGIKENDTFDRMCRQMRAQLICNSIVVGLSLMRNVAISH